MPGTAEPGAPATTPGPWSAARATRRRHLHTQRAAQLGVASELGRRGCQVVAPPDGQSAMEFAVRSPGGRWFRVAVIGLHKPGFWIIRRRPLDPELFYVLAYVPAASMKPEYFVLSHADVIAYQSAHLALAQARNPAVSDAVQGVHWAGSQAFRDRWDILPA